jgi:hypothetical protein
MNAGKLALGPIVGIALIIFGLMRGGVVLPIIGAALILLSGVRLLARRR